MIHTTSGNSRVNLKHLFLTNANIYLPMSNLTRAQRLMLDPETGPALLAQGTPEQLAEGMGRATYTPPRGPDDPEIEALAALDVPTTFIWGVYDTVSPPRVVSHVWNNYMMKKPGRNTLYFIPDANHYLQNDRPDAFVKVLLHTLEPADDQGPGALEPELGAPLLVDSSRERLPVAADLLRAELPAG